MHNHGRNDVKRHRSMLYLHHLLGVDRSLMRTYGRNDVKPHPKGSYLHHFPLSDHAHGVPRHRNDVIASEIDRFYIIRTMDKRELPQIRYFQFIPSSTLHQRTLVLYDFRWSYFFTQVNNYVKKCINLPGFFTAIEQSRSIWNIRSIISKIWYEIDLKRIIQIENKYEMRRIGQI